MADNTLPPLDGAGNPATFDKDGVIILVDGEIDALFEVAHAPHQRVGRRELIELVNGFDDPEQEISFLIAHNLILQKGQWYRLTPLGEKLSKAVRHD